MNATAKPNWGLEVQERRECPRCHGFMAQAFCADYEDDTGAFGFWALRCLQCGELVDPVILRNRTVGTRMVFKGRARIS